MCRTFTQQCSRNHYDIFLIGTGSNGRSLFCLVSYDPFVWQVWGLCLLVPLVSGVLLPLGSGVSVPFVSGVSVPFVSGVSVPLGSGVSVPFVSGVSVPFLREVFSTCRF